MPSSTASEKALRARIAAHAMHAQHDTRIVSLPGRQAFEESFYNRTDPSLPEAERRRRAEHLKKAHMTALALKSAKARRAKREAANAP